MALPRIIIFTCPGCDMALEGKVTSFLIERVEDDEEEEHGVALDLTVYSAHECDAPIPKGRGK